MTAIGVRRLSCWEQFLALAFAQLTHRESLRDIEVSLNAHRRHLYHSGFRSSVRKSTLADANEMRDWRIFAEFAQALIQQARALYIDSELGLQLDSVRFALDSTVIDLSLALFPWAPYEHSKAAVKVHTLLDLNGAIPAMIDITDIKGHDSYMLDRIVPEPGCFIVMDRGYVDFLRLFRLHQALAYFVLRAKKNFRFRRRRSHPVDRSTGVRSDQTIVLSGTHTTEKFPAPLRRVSFYAADIDQRFIFLTNNFQIPSPIVAAIYKQRWQVELFFRWIKQPPANQTVLGHVLQCGQNPNLDCRRHLCPDCHRQKATWPEALALHNSPNSLHFAFRENPRPACVSALR
jgi:Transposase DDE domain/Domain of unknown function (DUF4372)